MAHLWRINLRWLYINQEAPIQKAMAATTTINRKAGEMLAYNERGIKLSILPIWILLHLSHSKKL